MLKAFGGGAFGVYGFRVGGFCLGGDFVQLLGVFKAFAVDDSGVVGIGLSGFWIHRLGGYTTKHMEFLG